MDETERREAARQDSLNLLDYVVLGPKGEQINRAMGRTLNVSEKGVLLQTHISLELHQKLLVTIAMEEDMVEFKGEVVHIGPCDGIKFCSGIEFQEFDRKGREVLKKYLDAFMAAQGD